VTRCTTTPPFDATPANVLHPLIARLTAQHGYPRLDSLAEVATFTERPGAHCLFIRGDARRNLETVDAAGILPELCQAFQNAFDCAVVDDLVEATVRETCRALKVPGFLFFRDGIYLGSIEKVRDWSDYLGRVTHFLQLSRV
jgi:hydrogenase-1 operon protein HyaE